MWSYKLIVEVLKYFLIWGFCPLWFLSFGAFVLWCFCPFWLFFSPPMWSHDENIDCLHLYHVITWTEMESYTLMLLALTQNFMCWNRAALLLIQPTTHAKKFPLVTVHITHDSWHDDNTSSHEAQHMTTKYLHNIYFHNHWPTITLGMQHTATAQYTSYIIQVSIITGLQQH